MKIRTEYEENILDRYSNLIKDQVEKKNINIPQLAKDMEMSKTTLYAWIKKEYVISIVSLHKLLDALDLEIEIKEKN